MTTFGKAFESVGDEISWPIGNLVLSEVFRIGSASASQIGYSGYRLLFEGRCMRIL